MSEHPGELDALPLADLLDPDSAATKLELRHALGRPVLAILDGVRP